MQLGGPTRYATHLEQRPLLGTGPRPAIDDIERAVRLADQVEWLLVAALVTAGLARVGPPRRRGAPTSRSRPAPAGRPIPKDTDD